MKPPTLLQIFSRYAEAGGEEAAVRGISQIVGKTYRLEECEFENREWSGPDAPPRFKQAWMMFHNPTSLAKLRNLQSTSQASAWLVHNVFPVGSAAIFREALRQQVPVIYFIHNFRPFSVNGYLWANNRIAPQGLTKSFWTEIKAGAWQESRIKTAWFALILWAMHGLGWFRSVAAWIAPSDFMRDRFIAAGVPAEDIFTLPHSWSAMPEPPEPRDDGFYLFLGRLIEAKGVRILFETWKILRQQLGERAPALIIAGDGPLASWVEQECAKEAGIRYAGRVSGKEKFALFAGCRAVIAPSLWWEPLGLVTYEAYDFAKPMLAARSGGLAETVVDGSTGLLHRPGDAAELSTQICALDADPARRLAMGQAGRAWLLAHTGEESWLERFGLVVEHALRRGKQR